MYCSSVTAAVSSHLGWPKRPEHLPKDAPPPEGYGSKFAAHGLHPPPWEHRNDAKVRQSSNDGIPPCGVADLIRNGMIKNDGTNERVYGIEPLMAKYGVDVYLTGHEHNYERLWPTLNGSSTKTYIAPGKPVHVVTGAGGAYSKDTFGLPGTWDAFRSNEWSYSDIIVNRTHLDFRQRLATNSTVIDSFVLQRKKEE